MCVEAASLYERKHTCFVNALKQKKSEAGLMLKVQSQSIFINYRSLISIYLKRHMYIYYICIRSVLAHCRILSFQQLYELKSKAVLTVARTISS